MTGRPGLGDPGPTPGHVELTWVELEVSAATLERRRRWLSPAEQGRAARFRVASARRRFIGRRAALRLRLAQLCDCDPRALAFGYGPAGKPYLEGVPIHFNVTDSGDQAIIALTRDHPVGIDLEAIRPIRNALDIAQRLWDAPAVEALAQRPVPDQTAAFYRAWTHYEALVKATGTGLAATRPNAAQDAALAGLAGRNRSGPFRLNAADWYCFDLTDGPDGFVGCLAVGSAAPVIHHRRAIEP